MVERWYARSVSAKENGPLVFFGDYAKLKADTDAEIASLQRELEKCERMHLPAATVAAVQGHQQCMSAFNEMKARAEAAEASLAEVRKALEEIEDVDFDGYSISELHELVTDIARTALARLDTPEKK